MLALLLFLALLLGTSLHLLGKRDAQRVAQKNAKLEDHRLQALQTQVDRQAQRLSDLQSRWMEDRQDRLALEGSHTPVAATQQDNEPKLRIAVARSSSRITIEGKGLTLQEGSGASHSLVSPLVVQRKGRTLDVGGTRVSSGAVILTSEDSIRVGGKDWPGSMELVLQGERIVLINLVGMERYIAGVVSGEVPDSWTLEAKRAQAVAARSYAYVQMMRATGAWQMEATVADQVYRGQSPSPSTLEAVRSTAGQVLAFGDHVLEAFFHSTCGGRTAEPSDIWGPVEGFESVTCGYCTKSNSYRWDLVLDEGELRRAFDVSTKRGGSIDALLVSKRSSTGRVLEISAVIGGKRYTVEGPTFRRRIGLLRVRSTAFDLEHTDKGWLASGRGLGHGVGLCQWGALGMSQEGYTWQEILRHYYPKAKIQTLW